MGKNQFKSESTLFVSRVLKIDGVRIVDESSEEALGVHIFQTEPAVVGLDQGLMVQPKPFHSATARVVFRMPCYVEQAEEAYDLVQKFVSDRLHSEITDLMHLAE